MKKILTSCISILLTVQSFSQVDITTLNEMDKKIVKTFKDIYVEKTFKDPYSFKLLKLETIPKKIGELVSEGILFSKSLLEKKDFSIFNESRLLEMIETNEKKYSQMTDSTKNVIQSYKVRLDCYGTNSYGGQILGRYSFEYFLFTGDFIPLNYYDKPKFFFVTEIK